MELTTAISLIKDGVLANHTPQKWMELGAGRGLFTAALSHLLPVKSSIMAIDNLPQKFESHSFSPEVKVKQLQLDFVKDRLPAGFDGILMANALHFVADKKNFMTTLQQSLIENGSLIIVEYDTDNANPWVPFPISFEKFKKMFGC
jgi:trans-aconitate methyltransferase